jgi:hypothetical protein
MRKLLLIIAVFTFASTANISCSKENEPAVVSCQALTTAAADAGSKYIASSLLADCIAAKTAYTNAINCPGIDASIKLTLQQTLDALKILCP